ncbi:hypothetical protein E2562_017609, partial [Oryza meyeriana var. granulata]
YAKLTRKQRLSVGGGGGRRGAGVNKEAEVRGARRRLSMRCGESTVAVVDKARGG